MVLSVCSIRVVTLVTIHKKIVTVSIKASLLAYTQVLRNATFNNSDGCNSLPMVRSMSINFHTL